MGGYNPIQSVDGVPIPAPTAYEWGLQDVSKEGSGRDESVSMQKGRIGQVRKLTLGWENVKISDAAKIFRAFNPEYVTVKYLDAMSGAMITEVCYVGDRTAALWNTKNAVWKNIGFSITSKEGRMF